MRKVILIALFGVVALQAAAQFQLAAVEANLKTLILSEVNRVREAVNAAPLSSDPMLDRAALMQATYCKKIGKLSHYQKEGGRLYEPFQRVIAAGGKHDGVAENLLYCHPKTGQSLEEFARELVAIWVHSPGHYQNMVKGSQRLSGIGLVLDPLNGRLYACQVFAAYEWQPPLSIKINKRAYGIKPKDDAFCSSLDRFGGREKEFPYGFRYRAAAGSGQMSFYHANANRVKEMIRFPKGALAPDIVFRSQFPCGGPNLLHGSPYHDGYLLKPRTWKWLDKHNEDKSHKSQSLSVVTHSPKGSLNPDSLQINVVLTKQRHFCRYSFPVSISTGDLGPFSFELPPDTLPFQKVTPWKHRLMEFRVPFAKGIAVPKEHEIQVLLDSLKSSGGEVVSLRVRGYASIEGPLSINQSLMDRRAQGILERVQATQPAQVMMKASAAENWHDFRRDIRSTEWDWMTKLPDDRVRDTLKQDKALLAALESILERHRYSAVEVDVRFSLPDSLDNLALRDSFQIAVQQKQYVLAHRLQSEMIRRWLDKQMELDQVLSVTIPFAKGNFPLMYNRDWVTAKANGAPMAEITDFLVQKSGRYRYFLLQKTLSESQLIAKGVKPNTPVKTVFQNIRYLQQAGIPLDMIKVLELNYFIGAARAGKGKGSPNPTLLADIQSRYAGDSLSADEAVALGRFFNHLGGSAATVRLLHPIAKHFQKHEEFVFLLSWTAALHLDLVPETEWVEWMKAAKALNPERWQRMVGMDWQLLRFEDIKGMYCGCA